MPRSLLLSILAAGLAGALLLLGDGTASGGAGTPPVTVLAVDPEPSTNGNTSVGDIEECVEVDAGATFEVDIVVTNVSKLLGWEAPFAYDKSILEVQSIDVRRFQAANPNSNIVDASEFVPDTDGRFFTGAADIGNSTDSGSGSLARLTVRAVGTGVSGASLPHIDFNNDGQPDRGPTLASLNFGQVQPIGDVNGDEFFDGPTLHARIAVNTACEGEPPPPTLPSPTPAPGGGSPQATPGGAQPPSSAPDVTQDTDSDTLPDIRDADDDDDGVSDEDELAAGTDPLDATSAPEGSDDSVAAVSDEEAAGESSGDDDSSGGTGGESGGDGSGTTGTSSQGDDGLPGWSWTLLAVAGGGAALVGLFAAWRFARYRF